MSQTIRSRTFVTVLHVGLWVLLVLAVIRFRSTSPAYREATPHVPPGQNAVPVARLESVFAIGGETNRLFDPKNLSAFHTRRFIPVQPPPPPPPPPPTTRKIELTYQGFYQAGSDNKRVYLQVDGALKLTAVGERVATNLFIADAAIGTLMLTNTTAQTNLLKLTLKQVLEVPIQ